MKRMHPMLIAAALAVFVTPALADVPMLLNYQGRLTDPSGNPKNGTFTMQFAVYDAESGGNQLPSGSPWSETQSVTVTNGAFNVLLGSVTSLPANLFEGGPSDSAGPLRFLQVTVSGEVLAPRRRIVSAAYAMRSAGGASGFTSCVTTSVNSCVGLSISVPCGSDEVMTGGGCQTPSALCFDSSYPDGNGWTCRNSCGDVCYTVYARCCK